MKGNISAGRRRPVIKPAFGIKMNGRRDCGNRTSRGAGRPQKRGAGNRRYPVKTVAQKTLSLAVLRLSLNRGYSSCTCRLGTPCTIPRRNVDSKSTDCEYDQAPMPQPHGMPVIARIPEICHVELTDTAIICDR